MTPALIGCAVLLIGALAFYLWRYGWGDDTAARETVAEFARKFPGRCLICSLHRYGYTHGHESDPHPPQHECIERHSRA